MYTRIYETDAGGLRVVETIDGFLKAEITAMKPGISTYFPGGQPKRKVKLPEEVFSETTLDSLNGAPITDEHPLVDGKVMLVNSDNYNRFTKGTVSNPRVENGKVIVDGVIYDKRLINDIKNGKREVSIGFEASQDEIAGVYEGAAYDSAQRNIRVNHLAITSRARQGADVRIHIDSAVGDKNEKEQYMKKKWVTQAEDGGQVSVSDAKYTHRRLDGTDVEVDGEIHLELQGLKNKAKEVETEKTKTQRELDSANAIIKELKEHTETEADSAKEIASRDTEIKKLKIDLENEKAIWRIKREHTASHRS